MEEHAIGKDLVHLDKNKDLIHLDKKSPPFKNSPKFLAAVKEFIHNKNIPVLCILSEYPLLRRAAYDAVRVSAEFALPGYDPRGALGTHSTHALADVLRKNTYFSIRSVRDVYEGEVCDIKVVRDSEGNPLSIDLSLRTAKATKQVKLSRNLLSVVAGINHGDIVYVEPSIGVVKRLGRSETRADEYDLEGDRYLQLSKGSVHAVKEKETLLSLYDFDYAFNKYDSNITTAVRSHVDGVLRTYIELGVAKAVPSGICINSAELLTRYDLTVIRQAARSYPSLKVVIGGYGFSEEARQLIRDYFFTTEPSSTESVLDMVEYFTQRHMSSELKGAVAEVASFASLELIVQLLELTSQPGEFLDLFKTQSPGK